MADPVSAAALRLAQIRERLDHATTGPWTAENAADDRSSAWGVVSETEIVVLHDFINKSDAEFVAHARHDIPYLLAALARAEQTIREQQDNHDAIAERVKQAGENRENCGGSVNPLGAYWEGYAEGLKFAEAYYVRSRPATGAPETSPR